VAEKIVPVLLSGGAGTRLWPLSQPERPKQFLPLMSDKTMFAETLARTADRTRFSAPLIVANAGHRALIEADLGGEDATLLLEPAARNTAPAIALAALAVPADAPMLVMPSDHVISDVPAFHAAIERGLALADAGWLVTFGIEPTGPETGYGYIEAGEALGDGSFAVKRFIEKPDMGRAAEMIAAGGHAWNGGIFLFRADAYLGALAKHAPDILAGARAAMNGAAREGNAILPDADTFAACPSDSIDYAVMEKAQRVAVVPVSMGWSDIGSWDSLHENRDKDASGNAVSGGSIVIDTNDCLIETDGIEIAAIGVRDLIVIASGNKVLIAPRGHSQRVREVVEALKKQ
jgi:mannose-1-phosphate guanylyltransferase